MKFISILFIASVASKPAAERGLQLGEGKWHITDPTYEYTGLDLDLTYQISDYIEDDMVTYMLYTSPGCMAEGSPLAVDTSGLATLPDALTGDAYNPDNEGNGVRKANLIIGILSQETIINDDTIYTETTNPSTAKVNFCVRLGLQIAAAELEVTFFETLVTLFVDISNGGFEIENVNVVPKITQAPTSAPTPPPTPPAPTPAPAQAPRLAPTSTPQGGKTTDPTPSPSEEDPNDGGGFYCWSCISALLIPVLAILLS
jgi:hypothetical protein